MVESLTLPERVVEVEKLDHVDAIGLLEKEDFVDVLEHYLVIVGFAMQLAQITVEIQTVDSSGNQHGEVLDAADDFTCKLADICPFDDFLVEKFGSSHVVGLIFT